MTDHSVSICVANERLSYKKQNIMLRVAIAKKVHFEKKKNLLWANIERIKEIQFFKINTKQRFKRPGDMT